MDFHVVPATGVDRSDSANVRGGLEKKTSAAPVTMATMTRINTYWMLFCIIQGMGGIV
jgi:hypothetical protein